MSSPRIGALARPEPDPAEGLSRIAGDLDEFAEWMTYRAGRRLLVCLELFADVVSEEGVTRRCDGGVRSLYLPTVIELDAELETHLDA